MIGSLRAMTSAGELLRIYHVLLDRFGPQGWWPAESPFEVMVGAILTQNTAWRNVERAIDNLKRAGVLDPRAILQMEEGELAELIRPTGYFRVKARRLKGFVRFFVERFEGEVEEMRSQPLEGLRQELMRLEGIGPETADSILLYACEKPIFVVDAYTRRVLGRHRLLQDGAPYDEVQRFFMERLPRDPELFKEYHALLVRLGKTFCRPKARCEGCPLEGLSPEGEG